MSDVPKAVTTETANLLSHLEGDKTCDDPFTILEEDAEELENVENGLDNCQLHIAHCLFNHMITNPCA